MTHAAANSMGSRGKLNETTAAMPGSIVSWCR
jgi:hypothetical protein